MDKQGTPHRIHLPPDQEAELHGDAPGEKLALIIKNLPPDSLTLAELRDLVGQEGLLLLTALLTLVFMIPVSIPGVSTVFGAAILLIGVCRLLGRGLWMPKRFRERSFPSDKIRNALTGGMAWFRRLERISRPHRWRWLTSGFLMDLINNGALILGAILLMAPFGLVPFSNTLPALALLLLAIGLLQRDGACIVLGHLTNLATIAYFTALIVGGGATVHEIWRRLAGHV
jgi:hypothetical protein